MGPVAAEILLIWTNVPRTNVAGTNVMVILWMILYCELSQHTKSQPPSKPGSGLKVCGGGWRSQRLYGEEPEIIWWCPNLF